MKSKNIKTMNITCPICNKNRDIVFNATIYRKYYSEEKRKAIHNCRKCSTNAVVEERIKTGYFTHLNTIKASKPKIKVLKVGDVFNQFTIISDEPTRVVYVSKTGKRTVRALWTCQCSCGTICKKTTTQLTTKQTQCTKCSYLNRNQTINRNSDINRLYTLSVVSRVKKSKGRILNLLTLEQFQNLISQNCYYCGSLPETRIYSKNKIVQDRIFVKNGIDRINSSGHYSIDNCVPCCKRCNTMKSVYSIDDFFEHIKKIIKKHES